MARCRSAARSSAASSRSTEEPLGPGNGSAFYFAPDTLEWAPLAPNYSALVSFLLQGDLAAFYGELRWPGWQAEVSALSPDRGFHFHPPLFAEAEGIASRSRKDVLLPELLALSLAMAEQLGV